MSESDRRFRYKNRRYTLLKRAILRKYSLPFRCMNDATQIHKAYGRGIRDRETGWVYCLQHALEKDWLVYSALSNYLKWKQENEDERAFLEAARERVRAMISRRRSEEQIREEIEGAT